MHLTDIRIDEIVEVKGLPSYARGRATFTNGRRYHFDANFAHGYARRPHLRLASHRRQGHGPHHAHRAGNPRPPRLHRNRAARARSHCRLRVRARHGLPGAHASRHILTFARGRSIRPCTESHRDHRHQRGVTPTSGRCRTATASTPAPAPTPTASHRSTARQISPHMKGDVTTRDRLQSRCSDRRTRLRRCGPCSYANGFAQIDSIGA